MAFANVGQSATSWIESQALTRAAPSTSSDGVSLKDMDAMLVVVEATSTNTLSGAGSLLCYLYDPQLASGAGAWARCPTLDISVTATTTRQASPALQVPAARNGRVCFAASGVTVSAGTTVNVYVLGSSNRVKDLF